MASIETYDTELNELFDRVAADPDVTDEEFHDFLNDVGFQAKAAANAGRN